MSRAQEQSLRILCMWVCKGSGWNRKMTSRGVAVSYPGRGLGLAAGVLGGVT